MRNKKQHQIKLIETPVYSYWSALYMSMFSSRLYVDVCKRWRGFGLLYFFLFTSLAAIPVSIQLIHEFSKSYKNEISYPIQQLPVLMVQNGEISTDVPLPYYIKDKKGAVVIDIEPNSTAQDIEIFFNKNPDLNILVINNQIYSRQLLARFVNKTIAPTDNYAIRSYSFPKTLNEIFIGREWIKSEKIQTVKNFAKMLIYPMLVMLIFSLYLVLNLVLSSIGRIIAIVILKYKVSFKQSYRLALVASTGPFILFEILSFGDSKLQGLGLYYIAFVACYFAYGIIVVKRESQYLVRG